MIQAIIFDLDGILIDADKWHYNALNTALQHTTLEPISWQEHLTIYKGIPTARKLEILTERRGLSPDLWPKIRESKQQHTRAMILGFCKQDDEKIEMMRLFKERYKIVVCSNAIRETVEDMLTRSGLMPYVDFYLSNQDVNYPKPNPEIYFKAFKTLGLQPCECVIVEDSAVGKQAAIAAGGVLCAATDPSEVNYYRVLNTIYEADKPNIVIPAAGQGKRFAEAGFRLPKPLIQVNGRPMLGWVLDNFYKLGHNIILMQREHIDKYCAKEILRYESPDTELLPVDGITEGAACSVLLAKSLINNENELIVANSDQFVEASIEDFIDDMRLLHADGGILTFNSDHPKWSYARCSDEETRRVIEVAEKKPISKNATVGIYYYKHGKDFVKYAEQMIAKNIRVNNEFYVCPVYNEFLLDGKRIYMYNIDKEDMHGLGTPEDLKEFLSKI